MAGDLKRRIQDDIESAMRARDRERLGALRQISAAIKQREIDERVELDPPGVISVLERMIKQRRESLGHFESAGREDLAARESFEIAVIEDYMPSRLSLEEREAFLDAALAETRAASMKDMGKVMAWLKPKVQGRVDMKELSAAVKARLAAAPPR